jgi:uncharacterized membrane protein
MGKKLLIVGGVLALSGLAGLFSPQEKRRTGWMDRFGKAGNTMTAAFALLFGVAFLLAGGVLALLGN